MKRTLPLLAFLMLLSSAWGQSMSLSFTSKTEAKFYVYLNGRLQNEKSKGMITINNLEEKDYHIRIVIDDPYEITYTKTFRPSAKHNNYIVEFNPTRERVTVREAKPEADAETETTNDRIPPSPAAEQQKKARPTAVRLNGGSVSRSQVNAEKTKMVTE